MDVIILSISVFLQFSAAILSLYLIRLTGWWRVWIIIAIAMTLMGIRRSVSLYNLLYSQIPISPNLTAELIALLISILMITGVILIGPILKKTQTTNKKLIFEKFSNDNAHIAIYWLDSNFRIVNVNNATCEILGYTYDELVDMHMSDIDNNITNYDWGKSESHKNTIFEALYKTKDERQIPVEINISYFDRMGEKFICVYMSVISERKYTEKALQRGYRALAMISKCNDALLHIENENQLLNRICEIIVGSGGYTMAGVGLVVHDERKSVNMVASYGYDDGYLKQTNASYAENERGQGPVGIAIRSKKTFITTDINDVSYFSPWREAAAQRGFLSNIALPLIINNKAIGVLLVYSVQKNAFDIEDVTLLEKLTENLAFGFNLLRLREEQSQADKEIRKLSLSVEHSPNIVMITDKDAVIEYVNPKFAEITGYTVEETIGKKPHFFIAEDISDEAYRRSREVISSGKAWNGEFITQKKNGDLFLSEQTVFPILDESGNITNIVSFQEDITEKKKLSEQLSYQASHDELTGLVNRREFERRADRLLSTVKNNATEHALCFIDIDQFKVVNDTCGHGAGDELLRQISSVLKGAVRKRDTLSRLGGDEFGVLIENCNLEGAYRAAMALHNAIQDYQFHWEGHFFKVSVSTGLVPISKTSTNFTQLLRDADVACYQAKEDGRNRIHVFRIEDTEIAKRHGEMQWVERIYHALENNLFCLYAQTIESLNDSSNKHYELLVRMINKNGEIIPPDSFLPAAERYNLISKIDCWVIKNAFELLNNKPQFLDKVNFCSINLSGLSMAEPEFLDYVMKQLTLSGIDCNKICFEITETAAISNFNIANKFISTLNDFGCQFALDDFGSGLSSFAYLKNLPVNYLKIDGMFVKDIDINPTNYAMVQTLNEISHVMGMKTIAEFVENDVIKGMLKGIGVDYAQGYGIEKQLPLEDLLEKSTYSNVIKMPVTN